MKTNRNGLALMLCLALAGAGVAHAESFNYHGSLSAAGEPASGQYDLRLTLYSAAQGGNVVAGPIDVHGVAVTDGNFSVPVDFGASLAGSAQTWLAVAVKSGNGAWEALDGRSPVAPAGASCPGSWALDGNAGNPPDSYIGTADTGEVMVKRNGYNAIRVRGDGSVEMSPYTAAEAPGLRATSLGFSNGAKGNYSFAAGWNSLTNNTGSFVWGDRGSTTIFADSAADQFIIGAKGGVGINTATNISGAPLDKTLTIAPRDGTSVASLSFKYGADRSWDMSNLLDGFILQKPGDGGGIAMLVGANAQVIGFNGGLPSAAQPFKVGTNPTNGNGAYLSAGGTWTNASSRFFKQGFANVDAGEVLAKLVAMPMQTWYYLDGEAEGRHLGPVAEDFASAFGLGHDAQHISTVDANGVALAAIQGLNQKLEAENADLRARLDALAAKVEALSNRAE
ncbi:MAG: hypothetical protein F9K31_00780 [Dokdonella sp.]|nr:MAG: hypothetical protein F9K31_00780 [Dokdonella sp.]